MDKVYIKRYSEAFKKTVVKEYEAGGAAVLNKYAMVSLYPLSAFSNSTIFIKEVINFVFYLNR